MTQAREGSALLAWLRAKAGRIATTAAAAATAFGVALASAVALPAVAAAEAAPENAQAGEGDKRLIAAAGLFQRGLYKLAAEEYEGFLKAHSDHADATSARYALALCRYRLGEHAVAADLLDKALADPRLEPRDEALAVLGHCRLATKEQAKALEAFDRLLADHPASKHAEAAALNRVQVLYVLGRHEPARSAAEAFLRKYPASPRRGTAAYFLGLAHHALKDLAAAEGALRDLLTSEPSSPHAFDATLLLAQCLEAQGKLSDAVEQYRRAAKAAPADRRDEARFGLAVALHKSAKYDEAARELTALLDDERSGKGPYAEAARLQRGLSQLAGGNYAAARRSLAQVGSQDPARSAAARFALAQCDLAERKYESALRTLDDLARARPAPANLAQVAFQRALCLAGLDRHEEAAAAFAQFRERYAADPQAAEALYRHAFSLHRLGKYDESHAACRKLAAEASPEAKALAGPAAELDAENLFLLKRYEEAGRAFEALAAEAKDEARKKRFALRRGQSAHFGGDHARAAELLAGVASDAASAKDPVLVEALFLRGDALLQVGKHAEAAEALASYMAAVRRKHPEAQYKLALSRLRAGDEAGAERALDEMLAGSADPAASPWVSRGLLESAQLRVKRGRPQDAVSPLRKLLSANPPAELAAPATYLLGWIDLGAKRYAEAAGRFGEVVSRWPKDKLVADAAYHQGLALKEAGQGAQAIEALRAAVKADPAGERAAQARRLIAAIQVRSGAPAEAAATLESLAKDPKTTSAAVLYDLAWAHRGTKDAKAAGAAYQRLIRDFGEDPLAAPAAVEWADLLYEEGKAAEAAPLLEKAIATLAKAGAPAADEKLLAAARYRLGLCRAKLDDPAKAAAAFAEFAEKHPRDELAPSARVQAGTAYAAQGRFADAEKHLAAVVATWPKHEVAPVARLKLGEVQNELGNHDSAARTFQAYLDASPKDAFAHLAQFGIGWSLESRGKHAEARTWYAKVIAGHNGPTAARAQFQTGQTFMKEGKYEEAVKALLAVEDVYASPQWSPPALYDAGQAFEQLNQPDAARQQYEAIVKKYKESKVAELARRRLETLAGR